MNQAPDSELGKVEVLRVFRSDRDVPEKGIRSGDEVVELVDGSVWPRFSWTRLARELEQVPEELHVDVLRRAADREASVICFLAEARRVKARGRDGSGTPPPPTPGGPDGGRNETAQE